MSETAIKKLKAWRTIALKKTASKRLQETMDVLDSKLP